jgi:hypothetical protein
MKCHIIDEKLRKQKCNKHFECISIICTRIDMLLDNVKELPFRKMIISDRITPITDFGSLNYHLHGFIRRQETGEGGLLSFSATGIL